MLLNIRNFFAAAMIAAVFAVAGATAAKAGDHPHASFEIAAAKLALKGDPDGAWGFIVWSETPQGHEFWRGETARLESGGQLSSEARRALQDWVDEAEAGLRSPVPNTFVASAARRVLQGDVEAILQFVTWSETPQGHEFWSTQYDFARGDRGGISPLAHAVVEAWLRKATNR